jgi:hypothetical protein
MKYYLGVDIYHWSYDQPDNINFFFSDNFLKHHKKFRPSKCNWALDSGGFSQIHKHGKWIVTPEEYVERTLKYMDKMGKMDFAATQDWMCEDSALKITGKTVKYHQQKTIESYIKLKELAPQVPWLPVLQGKVPSDYLKHLKNYKKAGITEIYYGIGSICRRGNSKETYYEFTIPCNRCNQKEYELYKTKEIEIDKVVYN